MPYDEMSPAADPAALCERYRRIVETMAYQLETPLTPREDLAQAAYMSLVRVASRFNPAVGVRFSTFAKYRIRGAMLDARRLDRQRGTGREPRPPYKLTAAADGTEVLHCDCGAAEPHEGDLRCSACDRQHRAAVRTTVIGLCDVTGRSCEDGEQAEDIFAAPATQFDLTASSEFWGVIESCDLDARLLRVLHMRYQQGLTMREIGEMLNVNESRASQLHKAALMHLRERLSARGIRRASDLS